MGEPTPAPQGGREADDRPKLDEGARNALILALVAPFVCAFVLGIGAVLEGRKALERIQDSNGQLSGDRIARAAIVIGYIATAAWLIVTLYVLAIVVVFVTSPPSS